MTLCFTDKLVSFGSWADTFPLHTLVEDSLLHRTRTGSSLYFSPNVNPAIWFFLTMRGLFNVVWPLYFCSWRIVIPSSLPMLFMMLLTVFCFFLHSSHNAFVIIFFFMWLCCFMYVALYPGVLLQIVCIGYDWFSIFSQIPNSFFFYLRWVAI